MGIDNYTLRSGRLIRENSTIANEADGINSDGSRNARLTGNNVEADGSVKTNLSTALSEANAGDNIGIAKVYKGATSPAFTTTITATSSEISCNGFNSIIVHISGLTGTWDISVQNATITNGAFVDAYDDRNVQMKAAGLTAGRSVVFRGVLDVVKIVATNVAAGSVTVKVVPINL